MVGGIAAFYLLRRRFVAHARIMFGMAMLMAVFVAPLQLVTDTCRQWLCFIALWCAGLAAVAVLAYSLRG